MKTALITGGQQGIGLAIAQALHGAGWQIAICAERPTDDPSVTAALETLPGARYVQHDIANIAGIPSLLDTVGPITTLVSNAGVGAMARGDLLDMQEDSFDRCHNINLRGAFFLIQESAKRMLMQPRDSYHSIHIITSVSAQMISTDRAEYCISKSGAAMMAQAFAARLAPEGIGVFDIRPGIIRSPMTAPVEAKYDARIADGLIPAGRWGEGADIAQAILPLARGDLAYSTGAVIPVDGALSIPQL